MKSLKSFQKAAQNVLEPKYGNYGGQSPLPTDILAVNKLISIDKNFDYCQDHDSDEEIESNERIEKFLRVLQKQGEMLEKITRNISNRKQEDLEDEKLLLHNKFKKYEKFEDDPKKFYEKEGLNYSFFNPGYRKPDNVLEVLQQFQKFKDKNPVKINPPPRMPFFTPGGGPFGNASQLFPFIVAPVDKKEPTTTSWELNGFNSTLNKNVKKKKDKNNKNKKQDNYEKVMEEIVINYFFIFFLIILRIF